MPEIDLIVHTVYEAIPYQLMQGNIEDAIAYLCETHPDAEWIEEVHCVVTIIEPPTLRRI